MCSCSQSFLKQCFVSSFLGRFLGGGWGKGRGKLSVSKAASSNTAVNNICKAVHPFLSRHLVRVLTEDAFDALTDDERGLLGPHLCPHNQYQALLPSGLAIGKKAWNKHLREDCHKEFARRKVFAATCHFSASQKTPMFELSYQTVIIDEAGQVLEPDVIMPLSLHGDNVRLVLIGDHKQLPATVKLCS